MRAWAPGQITAFFSPFKTTDPLFSGSYGVSFAIEEGISAKISPNSGTEDIVMYNGRRLSTGPSLEIISSLRLLTGIYIPSIIVEQQGVLPISAGLSSSGAGALATGIAMNQHFSLGLNITTLGRIAHSAEVKCLTGLGSVFTQFHGGFLLRSSPGAPGIGSFIRLGLPDSWDRSILILSWGGLSTSEILQDQERFNHIRKIGFEYTNKLIEKPHFKNALTYAEHFLDQSNLLPLSLEPVLSEIKSFDIVGAGMAMLGNTLFILANEDILSEIISSISAPTVIRTRLRELPLREGN